MKLKAIRAFLPGLVCTHFPFQPEIETLDGCVGYDIEIVEKIFQSLRLERNHPLLILLNRYHKGQLNVVCSRIRNCKHIVVRFLFHHPEMWKSVLFSVAFCQTLMLIRGGAMDDTWAMWPRDNYGE